MNYSDNTHYLIYQKECPDENGIEMKENVKEETMDEIKEDFRDEIKEEFKVTDDNKSFVNVFNPLNNYFKTPSTSPSSNSHSSGEWVHI